MCSMSQSFVKVEHSSAMNCGPLSVMIFTGIPCLAHCFFVYLTTDLDLVSSNLSTSQKSE